MKYDFKKNGFTDKNELNVPANWNQFLAPMRPGK